MPKSVTDGRGFVNAGTSQDPARRWQLDLAHGPERERRRLEIDGISVRIRDGSAYAIALDGVGYLTELSTVGATAGHALSQEGNTPVPY